VNSHFSLLLFDLDNFKHINDRYGHLAGDTVLREFAQVVASRVRANDVFARWGGEEFILLLDATDAEQALILADALRKAIAAHPFPDVGRLTVSIGIAQYRADDDQANLLGRADRALYRAKNQGRDRVSLG
jgi:diguanylate cyclase (GGDEF)-like protein